VPFMSIKHQETESRNFHEVTGVGHRGGASVLGICDSCGRVGGNEQ
jgi:hypothetical protein